MSKTLRVLIVEDSESDAALVVRLLRNADYDVSDERVETAEQMRAALGRQDWDAIISDFKLPRFDAPAALALLRDTGKDVPFIVISGTVGENVAVAMMKDGAHDYMMKDNLTRLVPAVEREVREASARNARRRAEEELRRLSIRHEAILNEIPDIIMEVDQRKVYTWANPAGIEFFGDDVCGKEASDYFVGEQETYEKMQSLFEGKEGTFYVESWQRRKDGEKRLLAWWCRALKDADGRVTGALSTARDVTERRRSEEALRVSEERFRQVAENAADFIWEVDARGLYRYASPAVERILGYAPDELVDKKHFYDLFAPDVRDELKTAAFETFARKESFRSFPNPNVAKDGKHVILETSGSPVLDDDGTLIGYRGADTDVTERKHSEEELSRMAHEWQATFDATNSAIWILDQDHRVLRSNKTAGRIFGRPQEDMIGKRCWEIVHGTACPIPDCPILRAKMSLTRETMELQIDDRWLEVVADPILDAQGRYAGAVHIVADVTERKRAEQALADEAIRRRILIEQSRDGIVVLDHEGKVYEANRRYAEMLGYSREEVLDLHVWDWDTQWAHEQLLEMIRTVDEAGDHFETRHRRKDGSVYDVEISTNGAMCGGRKLVFCVCRDITERKGLEAVLERERKDLKRIIDSSPIIIFYKDRKGRFVRVNKAFANALEWPEERFVGKTVFDLYSREIAQGMHDDDREVMSSRRSKLAIIEQYQSASGLRWAQTDKIPILDDQGDIVGLIGFAQDITERKQAEDARRASEARFSAVFQSSPLSIGITRLSDDTFVDVNPAWIEATGVSREEAVGRKPIALNIWVHPEERDQLVKTLIERGEVRSFDIQLRRKSGDVRHMLMLAEPIEFADERCMLTMAVDITERKRVEEALQRSESDLRKAQTVADVGSWTWRILDDRLEWSDQMYRIFGIEKDSFTGDLSDVFARAIHPEDRAAVERANLSVARDKKPTPLEYRVVWPDGTIRVVWAEAGEMILDEAGNPAVLTGIAQDITERKEVEEALRRSEAKYRELVENLNDVVFTLNEAGRISYVSPVVEKAFGYAPSEVEGMHYEALVHPDDRPALVAAMRDLFEGRLYPSEFRFKDKSGVYRWLRTSGRPHMEDGRIVGLIGMLTDLTERKQAETALKESEEKFRAVFNDVSDGILLADLTSKKFVMANDTICRMLGYSRAELLELSVEDIHPADVLPLVNEAFAKQARREGPLAPNLPVRRRDGSIFNADINSTPIRLMGQDYLIGCFRDMTEKLDLEAQLRQAQKMEAIGRLAGGVAHDFNNLLGIIGGHAEITRQALPSGHPAYHRLGQLLGAVDRAAGLTRQLLAFSRKQLVQRQVVGLNGLVVEVQRMLARVIGEDIELRIEGWAARDSVRADPGQIEQVLLNLAVNARDAMTRGGVLSIATLNEAVDVGRTMWGIPMPSGPYCVLAVRDTGCGMTEETKARIFEPFFTTKPAGKGTGLGLATVYGIVRQSDGYVDVDSAPGEGTTFRVYLPLCEEEPEAVVEERQTLEDLRGAGRVMLVEDEEALREILAENLRDCGYAVMTASNGEEALDRVRQGDKNFDLLVTDVVMPLMSGPELADGLSRTIPDLRVMFMSGYSDDSSVLQKLVEHGVPFLEKPFTSRALARRVREAISAPPYARAVS